MSSFSGHLHLIRCRQDRRRKTRDKCMDTQAWARASLGSREQATITTTAAEEKTASQEARLQNMCPVRENKLSEKTTYLWAVCSSAISTSQGPKMDSASFNCLSLWLTLKEMFLPSLSLTHTHTFSAYLYLQPSPFTQSHKVCKWPLLGLSWRL